MTQSAVTCIHLATNTGHIITIPQRDIYKLRCSNIERTFYATALTSGNRYVAASIYLALMPKAHHALTNITLTDQIVNKIDIVYTDNSSETIYPATLDNELASHQNNVQSIQVFDDSLILTIEKTINE